jgi:putative ABC transport system ATP-binding protein
MDDEAAFALEHVHKQYGTGHQAVPAVADVSLRVRRGEFISIMGPSGCGKSTLLNLVAGLDNPTSGRVLLAGHDLSTLNDNQRSDLRLRTVGFVFQSFNLFPTFTVEENVGWPLEFLGVRWRKARLEAAEVLDQVGVEMAALHRRPAELSGGEQQRVAIARALVTEPLLLLADEPTGKQILDLLRRLNADRNLTIVLVTHSAFAATYGHRTVELRDGRIVHEARAPEEPPARVIPLRG